MRFCVLGPISVVADHDAISIGGDLRRALLARLLVEANRVVTADRLVDDLYPNGPRTAKPNPAPTNLRSHVSGLRRLLGVDRVRTVGGGYQLVVDDHEVDAISFELNVDEGRNLLAAGQAAVAADVLGQALASWRGPAYADFVDRPWVRAEAARLEELRLQAVEVLMDAHAAMGEDIEVIALGEPVLVDHPVRERVWARLIAALYREGRQSEALGAFGRLRSNLSRELGLEPSAELRALERAVSGHDPALYRGPRWRRRRLYQPAS